jgi:hypothetical protein
MKKIVNLVDIYKAQCICFKQCSSLCVCVYTLVWCEALDPLQNIGAYYDHIYNLI